MLNICISWNLCPTTEVLFETAKYYLEKPKKDAIIVNIMETESVSNGYCLSERPGQLLESVIGDLPYAEMLLLSKTGAYLVPTSIVKKQKRIELKSTPENRAEIR
jgi:hypothetical protein